MLFRLVIRLFFFCFLIVVCTSFANSKFTIDENTLNELTHRYGKDGTVRVKKWAALITTLKVNLTDLENLYEINNFGYVRINCC